MPVILYVKILGCSHLEVQLLSLQWKDEVFCLSRKCSGIATILTWTVVIMPDSQVDLNSW